MGSQAGRCRPRATPNPWCPAHGPAPRPRPRPCGEAHGDAPVPGGPPQGRTAGPAWAACAAPYPKPAPAPGTMRPCLLSTMEVGHAPREFGRTQLAVPVNIQAGEERVEHLGPAPGRPRCCAKAGPDRPAGPRPQAGAWCIPGGPPGRPRKPPGAMPGPGNGDRRVHLAQIERSARHPAAPPTAGRGPDPAAVHGGLAPPSPRDPVSCRDWRPPCRTPAPDGASQPAAVRPRSGCRHDSCPDAPALPRGRGGRASWLPRPRLPGRAAPRPEGSVPTLVFGTYCGSPATIEWGTDAGPADAMNNSASGLDSQRREGQAPAEPAPPWHTIDHPCRLSVEHRSPSRVSTAIDGNSARGEALAEPVPRRRLGGSRGLPRLFPH